MEGACTLNFLSFLPCHANRAESATENYSGINCDLFLCAAARMAMEDINTQRYGPVLTGAARNCTVELITLETKVSLATCIASYCYIVIPKHISVLLFSLTRSLDSTYACIIFYHFQTERYTHRALIVK